MNNYERLKLMQDLEKQKLMQDFERRKRHLLIKKQANKLTSEDYMASLTVEGLKTGLKMKALEVPRRSTHYNNAANAISLLGAEIRIILKDTVHGLTDNHTPQQMWDNMSSHIANLEKQRINNVQQAVKKISQELKKWKVL